MLTVGPNALGTPETTWRASRRLSRLAALRWGRPSRVVVVAPHPDDEVLGVGGILRHLVGGGVPVEIVAVTDGEGSHPNSTVDPEELAGRRRLETTRALQHLGIAPAVHRLGLPDGGVTEHAAELETWLSSHLNASTLCLVTWRGDGHPDHEACGRAAHGAAQRCDARLWEYPIWMWHWAHPAREDVPWRQARRFALDRDGHWAKNRAIGAFESQIRAIGPDPADQPVLPDAVLARFRRGFEIIFDATDAV